MADTTQKTGQALDEQLKPIFAHMAKAAHFSREAWIELEKALPDLREACPSFYEAFAHLMIGAYQNTQTIEDAADDLVRESDTMIAPPARQPLRLSGV